MKISKKYSIFLAFSVLSIFCVQAGGVPPNVSSNTNYGRHNETRFFAGLQWNFGDNTPELTLGVRRTDTLKDNSVMGAKFDVAFPIDVKEGKIDFSKLLRPTLRLMAVTGDRTVQGEFGFGLKTYTMKPLLSGGLQIPYLSTGTNYVFYEGFKPYAGFNSLKRTIAPKKSDTVSVDGGGD